MNVYNSPLNILTYPCSCTSKAFNDDKLLMPGLIVASFILSICIKLKVIIKLEKGINFVTFIVILLTGFEMRLHLTNFHCFCLAFPPTFQTSALL